MVLHVENSKLDELWVLNYGLFKPKLKFQILFSD